MARLVGRRQLRAPSVAVAEDAPGASQIGPRWVQQESLARLDVGRQRQALRVSQCRSASDRDVIRAHHAIPRISAWRWPPSKSTPMWNAPRQSAPSCSTRRSTRAAYWFTRASRRRRSCRRVHRHQRCGRGDDDMPAASPLRVRTLAAAPGAIRLVDSAAIPTAASSRMNLSAHLGDAHWSWRNRQPSSGSTLRRGGQWTASRRAAAVPNIGRTGAFAITDEFPLRRLYGPAGCRELRGSVSAAARGTANADVRLAGRWPSTAGGRSTKAIGTSFHRGDGADRRSRRICGSDVGLSQLAARNPRRCRHS